MDSLLISLHAARMRTQVDSAALRQATLTTLMEQLGIVTPDSGSAA